MKQGRKPKAIDRMAPARAALADTKKRLDDLCREVVLARDGHRCRRCGKKGGERHNGRTVVLHWCHVFSRATLALRWDLDNSFAGCAGCHLFWWHREPAEAVMWWRDEIGSERMDRLHAIRRNPRKPDFTAVEAGLQIALTQHGAASP